MNYSRTKISRIFYSKLNLIFTVVSLSFFISIVDISAQEAKISIIPEPNNVTLSKGVFKLKSNTKIFINDESLGEVAGYLRAELNTKSKVQNFTSTNAKNAIYLGLNPELEEQQYKLEITPKRIICQGSTSTGLFYGLQSILQMVNAEKELPCASIDDKPALTWRGFMLDESRHFHGKEVVKQYLDVMARLKLNRFHWHLTDESAWRIEIKRYPKLTTIGAEGSWSDSNAPAQFYTQEDIREIVEYARQRHIMVIPEIDMPGHATAASKAYPEISGGGEGRWKGFTFNPAKETTYEFISDLFDEIIELFPAPYIHIGADEVHYGNQSWYTDSEIQKFIKDNYLANEVGLEHYFVRRVCEMIHDKGKKMIGWDEIINTGVIPEKAMVMWWRHDRPGDLTIALNKGFDVILTPRIPCYFDFVQHDSQKIGRRWGKAFNELETVYSFPQSIEQRTAKHQKQILGLQANIWTERVKDKKRLDYMVFPRLLAIAEDGWTNSDKKDYEKFTERVKSFMSYLDGLGIYYFNIFNPESTPEPHGPTKQDVIAEG